MNSTQIVSSKKANAFPLLSEHPVLRYTTFIVLYFSQGIPEGLTLFAIAGATSPDAALLAIDSWGKLFISFKQVLLLRNIWLLVIITFIIIAAIHYMRTLLLIFTIQSLGWDNVFYSKIYSTTNLVGGIIGMVTGGIIIYRFGLVRMLQRVLNSNRHTCWHYGLLH